MQPWIHNAGREWCRKGGIKLIPYDKIDSLAAVPADPAPSGHAHPGQLDAGRIEVYLTKGKLDIGKTGGGLTFRCGTNEAYIILDFDQAKQNGFLLAHELGHVLDLMHPEGDTCADLRRGSFCSIMVPGQANPRNTERNISVTEMSDLLLGRPVFNTTGCCSWGPDAEAVGPIFQHVWNSHQPLDDLYNDQVPTNRIYDDGSLVFASDGSPNDTDPKRGVENRMYVQLSDCQLVNKAVRVYFYLADPANPQVWALLDNTKPLLFDIFANEAHDDKLLARPKTRDVPWTVPRGCPQDCWIYAVAVDKTGPTADIQKINDPPEVHPTEPNLRYNKLRDLFNQGDIHIKRASLRIPFPR